MNRLNLSRDGTSWFVLLPYWPFSYRFLSAANARQWAKKEGIRLTRAKHLDRPEKLCCDIKFHLGMHGPYDRDLTD